MPLRSPNSVQAGSATDTASAASSGRARGRGGRAKGDARDMLGRSLGVGGRTSERARLHDARPAGPVEGRSKHPQGGQETHGRGAPEQADGATPPSTKLTFNHPVNRSIQALEEGLTQLQIKADAILSRGNPKIKTWRKQLIKAIEAQLEQLDRFKTEAWTAQRAAHLESLAKETRKADECEEVEMNDEIMNTDVESVASDRLS